jgi:hypothetical protein
MDPSSHLLRRALLSLNGVTISVLSRATLLQPYTYSTHLILVRIYISEVISHYQCSIWLADRRITIISN